MMMENTLRVNGQDDLTSVFDLKGSTVDRSSPEDASTLKDINFIKMINQNPKFLDIP